MNAKNVAFRAARATDWPALSDLLAQHHLPPAGAEEHLPDFIVAEIDGTLAACAGLEICGDAALLRSSAVAARYRGQSLGTELTRRIIEHARLRGVRRVALLTTTAEDFFARAGFVRVERDALPDALHASEEFRGACPASAAAMVLMLTPAE